MSDQDINRESLNEAERQQAVARVVARGSDPEAAIEAEGDFGPGAPFAGADDEPVDWAGREAGCCEDCSDQPLEIRRSEFGWTLYDPKDNIVASADQPADLERVAADLDSAVVAHADYPHEPGRLYDCPACESSCHCTPGYTQCVFEGEHNGRSS
jgi:hypothetical protein